MMAAKQELAYGEALRMIRHPFTAPQHVLEQAARMVLNNILSKEEDRDKARICLTGGFRARTTREDKRSFYL